MLNHPSGSRCECLHQILPDCKCSACFACAAKEFKWGSRRDLQFHPYNLPLPCERVLSSAASAIQNTYPVFLQGVSSLWSGEVIYDFHYYNRLAAPKRVKIATMISPTFPSLPPHRRKSLINSVGITRALGCFYNLQVEFDTFWKRWSLQTSYSLQKHITSSRYNFWESCVSRSFLL